MCPRSDVYAVAAMEEEEEASPPRPPSPMNVDVGDQKHLRKAAPAKMLLPRTSMWLASLPSVVQPMALVHRFARIANFIAATWDDRKSFDSYMESLLTDKRGKRQGFPADVLAELVALQRYHDTLKDDESAWNVVGKRG